jgi:hypothetical protein
MSPNHLRINSQQYLLAISPSEGGAQHVAEEATGVEALGRSVGGARALD